MPWSRRYAGPSALAVVPASAGLQAIPAAATLDASDRPAIQQECPATFGNSDVWAWWGADPTP